MILLNKRRTQIQIYARYKKVTILATSCATYVIYKLVLVAESRQFRTTYVNFKTDFLILIVKKINSLLCFEISCFFNFLVYLNIVQWIHVLNLYFQKD